MRGTLTLLFCCSLYSQPPSPAPTKTAQDNQGKAQAKQREESSDHDATDKISSAINKLTAEVASWKQQCNSAAQKNDAPADWWLKWSTIVSAVATFCIAVLAWFQWRAMRGHKEALDAMATHMRNGLAETKKAADAAKESADAARDSFIAVHRPQLTVRFVVTVSEIAAAGQGVSGTFLIYNTGATSATIGRCYSEVVFGDSLPTRSEQYAEGPGEAVEPSRVLGPGQSALMSFPIGGPGALDTDERIALRSRQDYAIVNPLSGSNWFRNNLFLIGWIGYRDESGRPRRTGFCRRYDFTQKRFIVEEDRDYQYED